MPHFGLMDEGEMIPKEAALLRARLHLRCGRRRLFEGKLPEAVATLYDALLAGMRWYALTDEEVHRQIHARGDILLEDDVELQKLLREQGVWDDVLDFQKVRSLLDDAMEGRLADFDRHLFMEQLEAVLTRLGVLPFDEDSLPPEDPETL
ncbi:hypothetical protein [Desulfolithobacter sp.]